MWDDLFSLEAPITRLAYWVGLPLSEIMGSNKSPASIFGKAERHWPYRMLHIVIVSLLLQDTTSLNDRLDKTATCTDEKSVHNFSAVAHP
jgi:hypothetical protein